VPVIVISNSKGVEIPTQPIAKEQSQKVPKQENLGKKKLQQFISNDIGEEFLQ
jgi:hypothetical protein